jgi:hypothetical protein
MDCLGKPRQKLRYLYGVRLARLDELTPAEYLEKDPY